MDTNYIDFQRYVLEAHVLGVSLQGSEGPRWETFVSQEKLAVVIPSWLYMWIQGWGLGRDFVSASFNDLLFIS